MDLSIHKFSSVWRDSHILSTLWLIDLTFHILSHSFWRALTSTKFWLFRKTWNLFREIPMSFTKLILAVVQYFCSLGNWTIPNTIYNPTKFFPYHLYQNVCHISEAGTYLFFPPISWIPHWKNTSKSTHELFVYYFDPIRIILYGSNFYGENLFSSTKQISLLLVVPFLNLS